MQSSQLQLDERLIIFTHVPHYNVNGKLLAHGPYVNEINVLASRVREVLIVAPLVTAAKNISADNIPYTTASRLIPLPVVGGDGVVDKLKYLWAGPVILYQIIKG